MFKQFVRKVLKINRLDLQDIMEDICKYRIGDKVCIKYDCKNRIVTIKGITMRVEKGKIEGIWIFKKDSLDPAYTFEEVEGWLPENEIIELVKGKEV